ncbi:hypothetical protein HD806DRAFT_126371 [Xylariaceae sp. AK1471]|nr:hypothetical protein HD806DRAFT_126371 [Xylariaceae sp. AK1471]
MRTSRAFLSLPPSLLLLLATQILAQADFSQDNKDEEVPTLPTAVRKMSLDEGEKFMPEYYAFASLDLYRESPQVPPQLLAREVLTPEEEALLTTNSSTALALAFKPPFPRHYDYQGLGARNKVRGSGGQGRQPKEEKAPGSLYRRAREALARLQGRDFTCPGGTHVCSNINQPNYCCTDGTTCFVVENAPDAGNVGCCPDGQTCGGSVAACADGNTACPAAEGGGCCIPGFVCANIGCIVSTISALTHTTTTETLVPLPTPSTSITPSTSPQPTTSTSTVTQAATTSPSNTNSGSGSSTGTGLPPVRPTSSTPNTDITTGTNSYCPTGFYGCLATAGSGCCRTGRDCSTTSCPPVASTTITTSGATIVVPLTDADAFTPTATACASGWFLCGADAGPVSGCCPSGYMCGTASCTLSAATATATVQKELPGNAAGGGMREKQGGLFLLAFMILGWVILF